MQVSCVAFAGDAGSSLLISGTVGGRINIFDPRVPVNQYNEIILTLKNRMK